MWMRAAILENKATVIVFLPEISYLGTKLRSQSVGRWRMKTETTALIVISEHVMSHRPSNSLSAHHLFVEWRSCSISCEVFLFFVVFFFYQPRATVMRSLCLTVLLKLWALLSCADTDWVNPGVFWGFFFLLYWGETAHSWNHLFGSSVFYFCVKLLLKDSCCRNYLCTYGMSGSSPFIN